MPPEIVLTPIGFVHGPIREPVDDVFGGVTSRIELDGERFSPESTMGLNAFSHVEVVFFFHLIPESSIEFGARHPRGRLDWPKAGIFAQRGKNRPNRIGVTICRLKSVDGLSITVEGLDAIDGTPVLDIKPYMREFAARGATWQPDWATELMSKYWKEGA